MLRLKLLIVFSVVTSITSVHAQFSNEISTEDLLKGHDYYILDEALEVNIFGVENLPNTVQFQRRVHYKVLNSDGAAELKNLVLPENFDPTLKMHGPAVKKLGVYYSDFIVKELDVTIIRHKKEIKAKVQKKIKTYESFNVDYLYDFDQYHYQIKGLVAGDELKIKYVVRVQTEENYSRFSSYRIFFHSNVPKLKYKMILSKHESLDIDVFENNENKKAEVAKRDNIVYYTWREENLPGCINEENARPYLELPNVTWVLNQFRYYIHGETSYKNVPHYAIVASSRTPELANILQSVEIGSRSAQYEPFNDRYEELVSGMPEDHTRLKLLHDLITDEFAYQNDLEYYRRNDTRGSRMGEFFNNNILRDHSRYNLYFALMIKTRVQFYSAFVIDKRVGEVSEYYFAPNFDNDFLLATYFGERIFDFMLPKKERFGWYYNELPFYYEDCVARLVHISDYAKYNYPIEEEFRSTNTVVTKPEHNNRKIDIGVMLDLESDSMYCKGNVQLSGQFSTMTRSRYMGGKMDKSINPKYKVRIYDVEGVEDKKVETSLLNKEYPFNSEFYVQYRVGGRVKQNDGMAEIDLTGMFPHVVPKPSDHHRFMSYYSDFLGRDEIRYSLFFSRPVQLEGGSVTVEKDTEFGNFKFQVKQKSEMEIVVSSIYSNHTDVIPAQEFEVFMKLINEATKGRKVQLKVL